MRKVLQIVIIAIIILGVANVIAHSIDEINNNQDKTPFRVTSTPLQSIRIEEESPIQEEININIPDPPRRSLRNDDDNKEEEDDEIPVNMQSSSTQTNPIEIVTVINTPREEINNEIPLGIPVPSFGINEDYKMYDDLNTRNNNLRYYESEDGWYTHYIDNKRCIKNQEEGTYEKPLCDIPTQVQEGAIIEVHGGPYTKESYYTLEGTKEKPIFIRGFQSRIEPPLRLTKTGQYVIIEDFSLSRVDIQGEYKYVTIRNNNIDGKTNEGSGVIIANVNNILILNNKITNHGNWEGDGDRDYHGIVVGENTQRIWILENELSFNEGDGIQINSKPSKPAQYIFVGKNTAFKNKQSGFWTKYALDVIFSENTAYAHKRTVSAPGPGMGFQYGPKRVWFLFNDIYNNRNGIVIGSNSGPGFDGEDKDSYIIGNKIHDLDASSDTCSQNNIPDCTAGTAICYRSGKNKNIIGNEIFNVKSGITLRNSIESKVFNNKISNIDESTCSNHLFIKNSADVILDYNMISQNGNEKIIADTSSFLDPGHIYTLEAFKINIGKCLNCKNTLSEDFENRDKINEVINTFNQNYRALFQELNSEDQLDLSKGFQE